MAVHRYWRLTGFCTMDNGSLEISEARLYEAETLADAASTLSSTVAPAVGALADLRDGLASGVVSWPHAAYVQPGFALLWDFGAGAGIEVAALRLGSGNSSGMFPSDITLQYSDDGGSWTTHKSVVSALYPGALTLTADPATTNVDSMLSDVTLLVLDTLTDHSAAANPITSLGGVSVSTAVSRFGSSSLYFDGTGGLSIPSSPALCYLGGDFALEAWVYLLDTSKKWLQILDARTNAATAANWVWAIEAEEGGAYKLCFFDGTFRRAQVAIPLLQWVHVATTRVGSTLRHFLNGVEIGSDTLLGAIAGTSATTLHIGGKDISLYKFKGYLDGLRMTNGLPRYESAFTPQALDDNLIVLPVDAAPLKRYRSAVQHSERILPASQVPVAAAIGHLREHTFLDVYHGGAGIIYGTVKEQHAPANTPWRRRVLLIDERSRLTVRETWSDAATGAYEFRGIREGVKYTVLSYDHTGQYGAAVGDNITPEIIHVA